MLKSSSLWRLRLQYWGVLLKEQAHLKLNTVIGNLKVLVHLNKDFNVFKNLNHIKINNVTKEDKCQ